MTPLTIQKPENDEVGDHSIFRTNDAVDRDGVDATPSTNTLMSPRRLRRDVSKVRKMLNRSSPTAMRSPTMITPRSESIKPPLDAVRGYPDNEVKSKIDTSESGPNSPSLRTQGGRDASSGSQYRSGYQVEDALVEKQMSLPVPPRDVRIPASFSFEFPEKNGTMRGSYDLKEMSTPKTSIDEYDSHCISSAAASASSFEVPQNNEIEISKSIDEMVTGIDKMIDADFANLFQRNSEEVLEDTERLNKVSSPVPSLGNHSNSSLDKSIEEVVDAGLEEVMDNSFAELDGEPEVCVEDITNVTSESVDASKDSLLMSTSIKEEVRGMNFHTALKNEGGVDLSIHTNLSTQSSLTASIKPEMSDFENNDDEIESSSASDWDMSQPSPVVLERATEEHSRMRLPRESLKVVVDGSRRKEQRADYCKISPRARNRNSHSRCDPRETSNAES